MCCTPVHTLQEILEVEQVTEESQGMELNAENVDQVRAAHKAAAAAAVTVAAVSNSTCCAFIPAEHGAFASC